MDFSMYHSAGVGASGLDELANLAASYGNAADIALAPDEEDIEIGADVGEDLESDVEEESEAEPEQEEQASAQRQQQQQQQQQRQQHQQRRKRAQFALARSESGNRRARGEVDYFEHDEEEAGSARGDVVDEEFDDDTDDESVSYDPDAATPAADSMSYDLQAMFPTFEPGAILNFTDLLSAPPKKKQRLDGKAAKIKVPDISDVPLLQSTIDHSLSPLHPLVRSQMTRLLQTYKTRSTQSGVAGVSADDAYEQLSSNWELPLLGLQSNHALDMDDWENRITWNSHKDEKGLDHDPEELHDTSEMARGFRNADVDVGDWTKSIVWGRNSAFRKFTQLQLSVSQVDVVDEEDEDRTAEQRRLLLSGEYDPFNISNDRIYEATRERRAGVRQTLSSLEVQHAYPAKKLQLPFYKIQLSKSEARAFHRPALQFPISLPVVFSKVRSAKKKRDKASGHKLRAGEDLMHSTADLSLRDTTPFILLEYSEEYPPIMSNLGMGSILVNYYRKKAEKEEVEPAAFGETFVLEPLDETPFRKFGDVRPGETVQALYNDLIRAPVFRHNAAPTDFLVVKVSGDGETRYYLREIQNLYVVGQTLPLKEVPGPHSRRLTSLTKARLMLIARRLCTKSGDGRCHIQQLLKYFDDHTPLQMRQRIKDFMDFVGNGQWAFKPANIIPTEAENREVASPEEIVLYETMQVGQRHLLDAGYGQAAAAEGGNEDDSMKLDVEQQLAPWTSTKNFLLASQSKAMLALNGDGDPTGRGEAFSFLRISMKDVFVPSGVNAEEYLRERMEMVAWGSKKYNVQEQQEQYKTEITKIWMAQARALSNPTPPQWTAEDESRARETPGETPFADDSPGSPLNPALADQSASSSKVGKVLKIRRMIHGQVQTERIKDPKVIQAYLRQRQIIEDETLAPEDIEVSQNQDENERNKAKLKKVLATLKRNQQRRAQRRLMMAGGGPAGQAGAAKAANTTSTAPGPKKAKGTSRVCGNCGQPGHMKTNKSCPKYKESTKAQTEED